MASKTARRKSKARIAEADTTFRVRGEAFAYCDFCKARRDEHERTKDGERCPAGTTFFEHAGWGYEVHILTNHMSNWKTLDPKESWRYFEASKNFGWGEETPDNEERCQQTGYAVLLGADFEPDFCDDHWEKLSQIFEELDGSMEFDFTIRNATKWLDNPDWDDVDWHVQDPR